MYRKRVQGRQTHTWVKKARSASSQTCATCMRKNTNNNPGKYTFCPKTGNIARGLLAGYTITRDKTTRNHTQTGNMLNLCR